MRPLRRGLIARRVSMSGRRAVVAVMTVGVLACAGSSITYTPPRGGNDTTMRVPTSSDEVLRSMECVEDLDRRIDMIQTVGPQEVIVRGRGLSLSYERDGDRALTSFVLEVSVSSGEAEAVVTVQSETRYIDVGDRVSCAHGLGSYTEYESRPPDGTEGARFLRGLHVCLGGPGGPSARPSYSPGLPDTAFEEDFGGH